MNNVWLVDWSRCTFSRSVIYSLLCSVRSIKHHLLRQEENIQLLSLYRMFPCVCLSSVIPQVNDPLADLSVRPAMLTRWSDVLQSPSECSNIDFPVQDMTKSKTLNPAKKSNKIILIFVWNVLSMSIVILYFTSLTNWLLHQYHVAGFCHIVVLL